MEDVFFFLSVECQCSTQLTGNVLRTLANDLSMMFSKSYEQMLFQLFQH